MAPTFHLERDLPMHDGWDVIVVGGGPAGCTAAAAAAREGARTLLVEATSSLGGMGTSGLVPAWCPFSDKEKIIYRGLAEKVFNTVKAGMPHVRPEAMDWVPIDPELLKRTYDDLVLENGAQLLFQTVLSGVVKAEDGAVTALLLSNKAGLAAYRAGVYIDCTGDADLCAWAGAEFQQGDERGQNLMPATHCFILSNVDDYAYAHGSNLHGGNPDSPIYSILRSGKYPLIPDAHTCQNTIGPGTVGFNTGHLFEVDSTDPLSLSRAYVAGRKLAAQYREALAETVPAAFGNAFLVSTASLMGIRESRRVVGDYVLTLADYVARRCFPDEICRNSYYIDVHNKTKEAFRDPEANKVFEERGLHYGPGESHGIPYRCLTPKGLRNVLVAGRSISCEQEVQASVRVMPTCLAMGEAAGLAAAQAADAPAPDVHRVDPALLRGALRQRGAYLP
jgi:hypothetical protein